VNHFWLFLHLAGIVLWLGGGVGVMFVAIANKATPRDQLATVARSIAAVYRSAIAPGAALVVISGVVLTMRLMADLGSGGGGAISPWILTMQGTGLLAAALLLVVLFPRAARLARLDPIAQAAAFDAERARIRLLGAVIGLLGAFALFAGAMSR
jgi:hypothetical protein